MIKKSYCFSLLLALLCVVQAIAQDRTITGTVTNANDGVPLPGVNVVVQGTSRGTQTDFDGKYSIQVSQGEVLQFSYVGLKTQEITVGAASTINVQLQDDASQLDEVVVTALGVKRQRKSLTYATQTVEASGIDEARPEQNLVNGLTGKVAGLSIQRSGNGVSGSSKVVLRGNRSINGSSQALYVVDGVPLGGDINNLSPDDIASISVLKGANAAALYGARANNGAIIITTKSGQQGSFAVDLNTTITTENANLLFDYQDVYGQGSSGIYNPNSVNSWGPRMDGSQVDNWSLIPDAPAQIPYAPQSNNVKDFFQTGISQAYNINVSAGNEVTRTFFSYTNDQREGIVPGNELTRHNVSLKLDNKLLNDKLEISARANYIHTITNNELYTGENFANPLRHAYRLPRNIRTQDAEKYQFVDPATGQVRQNYWKPFDNGGANPYWTINKNLNEITDNRLIGFASATYNFTSDLSLLVRTSVDQADGFREDKWHNDSYIIAQNGRYFTRSSSSLEWNNDFLLSYNKQLSDDFSLSISGGGNQRVFEFRSVGTENAALNVPNIFAISNATTLLANQSYGKKKVNSLYTFGQLGWKDAMFLDLTYRSDWSSTLPEANNRFDYYSAGLSTVLTDLVSFPEAISFLKLRGSYAEVGNDTDPYQLARLFNIQPGGFAQLQPNAPNENLKPERTKSLELGFDIRFIEDRLGLDFTYYRTNSVDQLFSRSSPTPSGAYGAFINGGDIQNRGVEIILTAVPVRTNDFSWDITANFTKNTSEVLNLADGIERITLANDASGAQYFRTFVLEEGEPWGNMYSRGFVRDDQGRVVVGADGTPLVTPGQTQFIGNYNPDWLAGLNNSFQYRNFSFSFLIDMRYGGQVGSFTNSNLAADGALASTLEGRDGTLVFGQDVFGNLEVVKEDGSPNDIQVSAEAFWNKIGGRNTPVGEAFVEDATNIRLREMTLGYSVPASALDKSPFRTIKVSLVGRNLFFFRNDASFDPEVITSVANSSDGFESFAPPTTRSLGLNLKLGF